MAEEVEIFERLKDSIINADNEAAVRITQEAIAANIPALKILREGMVKGIEEVGIKFGCREIFLVDLVLASQAFKESLNLILPQIKAEGGPPKGKFVIGTVQGDEHDFGKNIVATMLMADGFEVYDLGTNVPPEDFVKKAMEVGAHIVGSSSLLSITMRFMKEIEEALRKANIRDKIKTMVGGSVVTREFAREIGADGYGEDAVEAVKEANRLLEELRKERNN